MDYNLIEGPVTNPECLISKKKDWCVLDLSFMLFYILSTILVVITDTFKLN
jgi:hypothetical protein